MVKRNSRGQVIRVFTYSSPMRKHGGDVQERSAFAALDVLAQSRVTYSGPGYIVRKASAK